MINSVVNTGLQRSEVTTGVSGAVKAETPVVIATPAQSHDQSHEKIVDTSQLSAAVSKLNDYVQSVQRDLSFSVDKDTGQTVVKVYDAKTQEVIRQIPAEETLRLAASIDKQVSQLFIKEKA